MNPFNHVTRPRESRPPHQDTTNYFLYDRKRKLQSFVKRANRQDARNRGPVRLLLYRAAGREDEIWPEAVSLSRSDCAVTSGRAIIKLSRHQRHVAPDSVTTYHNTAYVDVEVRHGLLSVSHVVGGMCLMGGRRSTNHSTQFHGCRASPAFTSKFSCRTTRSKE